MIKHCSALTILAGVGACFVVAFAPIAGADDPPCEQRPPDQQQQCQQNPGADIANQVVDQVIDGVKPGQPVQPFIDPETGQPNSGQAGLRVLVNGVDTCLPVGVPAPLGADVRIVPGDMTGHCIVGP